MQLFLQRCAQQKFFGVSHDATLRGTVVEVELDPTSAIVARHVARKVAPCVQAFSVTQYNINKVQYNKLYLERKDVYYPHSYLTYSPRYFPIQL